MMENQPSQQVLARFLDKTHVIVFPKEARVTETSILQRVVDKTGWPLARLQLASFDAPFCTIRVVSSIVGGKGGFGTLLKGQSRQAGAKLTTDFGACRDLQGRRLRHVNDEIKLRRWKERQRQEKNGIKPDEDELWKTPSGIYNWHLMVPTWADISKKATFGIKRQFQKIEKEETAHKQRRKDKETAYQNSVTHYADQAKGAIEEAQTTVQDAIRQGLESKKRKRQQQQEETNHGEELLAPSEQPTSLVTLSGDIVVLDTSSSKNANPTLQIQSKSDFGTVALVLDKTVPESAILYYEVKLITGGLAQIGWASLIDGEDERSGRFAPNDETGDGVGDDAASYGFDPCRLQKFHSGEEEEYGSKAKKPAKPGDVLGCFYDKSSGKISFALNGKDLGTAFTVASKKTLFPAISCNQDVAMELRTTAKDCQYYKPTKKSKLCLVDSFMLGAESDDVTKASGEVSAKSPATIKKTKPEQKSKLDSGKPNPAEKAEAVASTEPELLDLDGYASVSELEALGMERLKSALMALRVKCGGSLSERASRLFSLKGLARMDYPKKVRGKNFFL